MTRLESRLFAQSFAVGIICTLIVVTAQAIGLLSPFDDWLYDKRATYAQFTTPPPSKQILHLDIDDAALGAIGRWPWPRATQARILEEVHLAAPSAVGLDILYSEPQAARFSQDRGGKFEKIDDDSELATALRDCRVSVLATSFNLEPAEGDEALVLRAVDLFKADLELPQEMLLHKLGPAVAKEDPVTRDALFLRARGIAMQDRIEAQFAAGQTDFATIERALLPTTDLEVAWPQTRQLKDAFTLVTASRAVSKFGIPMGGLQIPALEGSLSAIPLAQFSGAVAKCGFANYDIFESATVRSVPLFVRYKDRLYPQFGMAVACVSLGADLNKLKFDGNSVMIPARDRVITIPTYTYHSRILGQDVPLIAAIPWFGGHNWQTMYDWPNQADSIGHVSINKVWDVCLTHDIIVQNSKQIDAAIVTLLANVVPEFAQHYAGAPPDPMDISAREAAAKRTLSELKDAQLIEGYDSMPAAEMKPEDREIRDNLHKALHDMNTGISKNRDASLQLAAQRRELASLISGKAVFIGLSDVSLEDKVRTSLHQHSPGVVVHGVIASDVLTGFWWRMAPSWIVLVITMILGMINAAAQGWLTPVRAGLFAVASAVLYWIFNWGILFALERVLVGMAGPLVVVAVVWAVCTLLRVVVEGIERIRIATENEIFQKEMSLARKVQFALVPDKAPEMSGINADGWTLPADMTGGDLFDLWKLPDGRLGILVADASGHGLAPAMIVSQVRTLVHMLSEYEASPHDLLRRVNSRLALDLETGRFVTAFLAFIKADGEFEWASAGHGPMYWCPTGEGELIELDSSGLPLGVQEDWLADDPTPPLKMELTGRLIVFSDGIFEAHAPNPKDGLFGTDPIKEILQGACHATSSEIIHKIREAVQKFQGKKEPVDDQTIVVVRRVPPEDAAIDGDAVFSVSTDSPATLVVPIQSGFEISVDNPVLETPQSSS